MGSKRNSRYRKRGAIVEAEACKIINIRNLVYNFAMTQDRKKSQAATREEQILEFWQENKIFQKTLEKQSPKGEFVFYDGPPFATGLPHYGHLLAGTIKDVIPRYQTMQGFHVPRKWGWDCHGLPLENLVEKELKLESKKDIQEYGVAAFNEHARSAVLQYADDWRRIIPRTGRWVDMDNDYRTMDTSYSESVWWAFQTLYNKKLIYKDFKSMHLCPRCETTLSNFEVGQGYADVKDISVTVRLPLIDEPGVSLLVWTTTPWTLPGNVAAAVGSDVVYAYVQHKDEILIIAEDLVADVFEEEVEIIKKVTGEDLAGTAYMPPFTYYHDNETVENRDNAWKVYTGEFVTTEDGTGIVHIAPAFGSDDMQLARTHALPIIHHVGTDGAFVPTVTDFAGIRVKQKDDTQSADIEIIKYLAGTGSLFKKQKIEHSYPHCWRCATPLLNYAADSWFVDVTKLKPRLLAENKKVKWVPEHIGSKRFHNLLEGAPDWAISRSRYWGAPIPVWKCEECPEVSVIGSIDELKKRTAQSGNTFFVMRHGESVGNLTAAVSSKDDAGDVLTEKGEQQVADMANRLDKDDVDLIITSPYKRTQQTANIIAKQLGLAPDAVIVDERVTEFYPGDRFKGKTWDDYHTEVSVEEQFDGEFPGGENRNDVRQRAGEFLYDVDLQHENTNILVVTHEGVADQLHVVAVGATPEEARTITSEVNLKNAEVRKIDFTPIPHNQSFALDLHRPYIDGVVLACSCGGTMRRITEVFDCWFESGSMSYASNHYPFSTEVFQPEQGLFKKQKGFPAQFIAEGLDQTRGWFYSSLVLGVALFNETPYQNVIVNGIIQAEDGQKMSKSLQNYPDPLELIDTYGVDAMRYYMMASAVVRAEDLNFAEAGVDEVSKKVIARLENVLSMYQLYADQGISSHNSSESVLDVWIVSRVQQLIESVTASMDTYELDRATRPIGEFVDDLSTWYVRRSRDRIKGDDSERALGTLRYVLLETAKVCAPFTPFIAERIYQTVEGEQESVHLADWPHVGKVAEKVLTYMSTTREVVSQALEARARAGIKVRQPLAQLTITEELPEEYLVIIAEEVNVKEVLVHADMVEKMILDTELTEELRNEGKVRDLIRMIQVERKKTGLAVGQPATVAVTADGADVEIYSAAQDEISEAVQAKTLTLVAGEDSIVVT